MAKCKSKGCNGTPRMRSFKGSVKKYSEGVCGICMSTLRRYGLTGPERDAYVASGKRLKQLTVGRDPTLALFASNETVQK